MKTTLTVCLIALATGVLHAQTAGESAPKNKGGLVDAAKRLLEDKEKLLSEDAKKKAADAAKAALDQVPDDVKNKARNMIQGPQAAEARSEAIGTVQAAIQTAKGADKPESAPAAPAPPSGPRPQPLQPLVLDDPQAMKSAQRGQTVITATQSAFFDADSGKGIYTGNVRARHPQMAIDCDELEIHMKKQDAGAPRKKAVAATDVDILASGSKKSRGSPADSGIEMAYARGRTVTIEKRDENGELQIAHCNEVAIYDGKTGGITLRGMPSVQRGNKLIEATDPRTYMIIDQKGKLTVLGGPQRTTLIDDNAPEGTAAPGLPVNTAPPAPNANPAPQQR
jgi:lipopolysaccharide export system protein LptA